jgi:hypothetical protein
MTSRIHTGMDRMQTASGESVLDCTTAKAQCYKLSTTDDAMLPISNAGNRCFVRASRDVGYFRPPISRWM